MKNTLLFSKSLTLLFFALTIGFSSQAQVLNAPNREFGSICASTGFNSFSVNFDFSGFGAGNTFVLEMSDANGSFTTLTPITILSSQLVTSPGRFTFKVPENITTAGKNYRLRVKSTAPVMTSGLSTVFNAYFWVFNSGFRILDNGAGALSVCGNTGTLSIDPTAPSPLQHPGLKYVWRKNGIIIAGEVNSTLTVTTPGTYNVAVDYGNCNSVAGFSAYSQDVTVTFTTSSTAYTITSSLGTNICPSSPTTLSTTAGQTYQWYRNDSPIAGANSYFYQTAVPGTYKVVVSPGTSCQSTSNSLTINAEDFDLNIDAQPSPSINYIPEGGSLTVNATTSAASPTYQWQDSTGPISGATTNSETFTLPGKYKIVVTQTTGCVFSKNIDFEIKIGVEPKKIPNVVSLNGVEENRFWMIPKEYQNQETEIKIISSTGQLDFQTNNYQNNWPDKVIDFDVSNPVYYYIISKGGSPIKKGSITVIK